MDEKLPPAPTVVDLRIWRNVVLGTVAASRFILPGEHRGGCESNRGNRRKGAPPMRAQVLGGYMRGVPTTFRKRMLERTDPLLNG